MILIKPMQRALELVRMFGGIEKSRLAFILGKEFPKRDANNDIDRLLRLKLIIIRNEAVYIPNLRQKEDAREAVEIMCLFWNKYIIGFERGQYPVLIKFVKMMKGKAHSFYVCNADGVADLQLNKKDATVIVITDTDNEVKTAKCLTKNCSLLQCEVVTAVKEYGKYYFKNCGKEQF